MEPRAELDECESYIEQAEDGRATGSGIAEGFAALMAYYQWRVGGGEVSADSDDRAEQLSRRLQAQLDFIPDEADASSAESKGVKKTILRLTVLHPAEESLPSELDALMSYIDEGSGIGQAVVVSVDEVPEEQVLAELQAIGNDGSFFDDRTASE